MDRSSGSPRLPRSPPERRSTEPGPSRLGGLFSSFFNRTATKSGRQAPADRSPRHRHGVREDGEAENDLPDTQAAMRDGPITAPGGWSSLLTWRGAAPEDLVSAEPGAGEESPSPASKDVGSERRIHSRRSSSVDSKRHVRDLSAQDSKGRGRSRGAIPFDLSPPTATSGLPSPVTEEESRRDGRYESPFASPSRKGRSRLALDALAAHLEDDALSASPVASPSKLRAAEDSAFEVERQLGADAYGTLSRLSHISHRRSIPALPRASQATLPNGRSSIDGADRGGQAGARGSLRLASAPTLARQRSLSGTPEDGARWDRKEAWQAGERERIDECVRMCVTPAGVDYESRPIVVLSVCSLPDPKEVDYDHLFLRLMSALNLFVENDYTAVLFAGAGRHRPGWNWLWKAYKALTRNYRKNLKRLYIVHPTLFTKTLVQFISTGSYFVSPKFARKIVQCGTLAELGRHVPLQQIELPPEVLTHDMMLMKGQASKDSALVAAEDDATPDPNRVFGVALETLMGESGDYWSTPRVVKDCIELLRAPLPGAEDTGELLMDTEGIFRRSPPSNLLRTAQMAYDGGHPVNLERYGDGSGGAAHMAAALLKTFLRRLPSPLVPPSLYPLIKACPSPEVGENGVEDVLEYIRSRILPALAPPCKTTLLATVCELLHDVAQRAQRNKMDAANLATVIAPNLVRGSDPIRDVAMCRVEGISNMHSTGLRSAEQPQGVPPATLSRGATAPADSCTAGTKSTSARARTLGTVLRICIEHAYEIFPAVPLEPPMNTSYSDSTDGVISGAVTPAQPSSPSAQRGSARQPPLSTSVSTWTDSSVSEGRPSSEHALLGLGFSSQTAGHSQQSSPEHLDASATPAGASKARDWTHPAPIITSEVSGRSVVGAATHDSPTVYKGASVRSTGGARSGEGGSFRSPGAGFGTLGKSSAGSLRLTKGRLGSIGSGASLRSASTLAATSAHANSIFAQGSPLNKTMKGDSDALHTSPSATGMVRHASAGSDGLVSSPSGVSLSGANASGRFSTASASGSNTPSPSAQTPSESVADSRVGAVLTSATRGDGQAPLSAKSNTAARPSQSPRSAAKLTPERANVPSGLLADAMHTPMSSNSSSDRDQSAAGGLLGQPISRHLSAPGGGRPLSEVVEHDDDHLE